MNPGETHAVGVRGEIGGSATAGQEGRREAQTLRVSAAIENIVEQCGGSVDSFQPGVTQSAMVIQTDRPVDLALFDQQLNGRTIFLRRFHGRFELFTIEGDVVDSDDLSF